MENGKTEIVLLEYISNNLSFTNSKILPILKSTQIDNHQYYRAFINEYNGNAFFWISIN